MASRELKYLYRQARKAQAGGIVGESAMSAWRAAQILRKWRALEAIGYVRISAEPDHDCEWDDDEIRWLVRHGREVEALTCLGEYCLPDDDDTPSQEWTCADSVGGFLGYRNALDWRENPYILDIMAAVVRQFATARKAQAQAHAYACATTPTP